MISTSPMEGFPNIFVEAWACGIPVFSLSFDPGGVIRKERLGEVADGNIDKLVNDMFTIKNTDEFAKRSRAYVERNHLLNADKINEINDLFTSMVEKKNLKRLNGHFK